MEHMTEAEVARDLHAVLERVRHGVEIAIQQDDRIVAVLKSPQSPERLLSECIALAEAHGSNVTLDEEFSRDLEEIIQGRREPLTSRWD